MKSRKIWKICSYVLAGLVMCTALVYYNFIDKPVPSVEVGAKCPDFSVSVYDRKDGGFVANEQSVSIGDLKGKIVVVNFWSTTCGSCMYEMPHFDEFQKAYKDEVVILALDGEKGWNYDRILSWMNGCRTTQGMIDNKLPMEEIYKWETFDITFGWYDMENNDVGAKLGFAYNWPSTAIIDKNGFIKYKYQGRMSYEDLENVIKPML